MKNWNDFLTEFVLRAMARPDVENYNFPAKWAAHLAREAWDAIQAAELPESEKAKQTKNSYDLKLWAKKAIEYLGEEAEWIAIDSDRTVWAYDVRPNCITKDGHWSNSYAHGCGTTIDAVDHVEDWTKECYEISKILAQ